VRGRGLLFVGLTLLAAGIIGLVLLSARVLVPRVTRSGVVARGEWIFRTGADLDGRPIPYEGGMPMRMACASCHGVDGRGLRTMMFISPDVTYRNLTDPAGMIEPDGGRGPRYTDELIRRAVVEGIDAESTPLAWPMPRWLLTDREWQSLLAYLKTLR
jgi:hypothetical protein